MKKIILISLLVLFGCNSRWSDDEQLACFRWVNKDEGRRMTQEAIVCYCDWLGRNYDNFNDVMSNSDREEWDRMDDIFQDCRSKFPKNKAK